MRLIIEVEGKTRISEPETKVELIKTLKQWNFILDPLENSEEEEQYIIKEVSDKLEAQLEEWDENGKHPFHFDYLREECKVEDMGPMPDNLDIIVLTYK